MNRQQLMEKLKGVLMEYEHLNQEEVQCKVSFPTDLPWKFQEFDYFGSDGFQETVNGQLVVKKEI